MADIIFGPKPSSSKRYEDVRRWRALNKKRLVIGFGGRCAICGVVDNDIIYDFHHRVPSKKDFAPSTKIKSWALIVEEIKKCVMLCSHCHRKLHAGLVKLPLNAPIFNEALVAASPYAFHVGPHLDGCPICGTMKRVKQKVCSLRCWATLITSPTKPKDVKILLPIIIERGYRAVGKEYGVSDNAIRKWLRSAGVKLPRGHPSLAQR